MKQPPKSREMTTDEVAGGPASPFCFAEASQKPATQDKRVHVGFAQCRPAVPDLWWGEAESLVAGGNGPDGIEVERQQEQRDGGEGNV